MNIAQKILDNAEFISEDNLEDIDAESRKIHDFILNVSGKFDKLAHDEIDTWMTVVENVGGLINAIPQSHFKSVVTFIGSIQTEIDDPQSHAFHKLAMEALKAQVLLQMAAFYQAVIYDYADEQALEAMEKVSKISQDKMKERDNRPG